MLRTLALGSAFCLILTSCGGAPKRWGGGGGGPSEGKGGKPAPTAPKVDYGALGEREVSGAYPVHPVNALGGALTGQLQATAPPDLRTGASGDGTPQTQLTFRIGAGGPMVCWVRGARTDAGTLLQNHLDEVKKEMEKHGVKGQLQTPEITVEVEGNHPVLYADVPVVVAGANNEEKRGLIKLGVSTRDGGSLLCMHDEVGYRKTFRRIVGGFVTSLTVAGDRPQPVYTEISIAKLEGKTIGFAELYEFVEPTQIRTVQVLTSATTKRVDGKTAWTVSDSVRATFATPKGEVISIKSMTVANKKQVTSVELKRGKGPLDYVYEGVVNGTKVKGSFSTPRLIETESSFAVRAQQVASGKAKDLKYLAYDEEQRVEGPLEITVTREDPKTLSHKADDGRVWTTSIDALGLPERVMHPRDKAGERLIIERAYSQGQPSALAPAKKPQP